MSYKTGNLLATIVWIAFVLVAAAAAEAPEPSQQLRKANADLVTAATKYRTSVEALIPRNEQDLKNAIEALETRKDLYTKGLISKLDLDAAEQAVKTAQAVLGNNRKQIEETAQLIAEAKAERIKPILSLGTSKSSGYTTNAAIMRYGGAAGWAISNASKVEGFFASKFGRRLPVSAYGQSATHNRMGFDHRNSVDVALHPDSAEGKALIDYLRSNGIPYLAFRSAVPGAATGAHIHIGYPSHRR